MIKETLKVVLQKAREIPWDLALYLPKNMASWHLDTLAIIEDPDNIDSDDPDDDPDVIKEADYRYVLSIQILQSIVANAKSQEINITEEELLQCVIYYFNHDAYLML